MRSRKIGLLISLGTILVISACQAPPHLSFNEDIAPIIYKNCQSCHWDEGIAPFSFTNYEEVAEKAKMIKKVTQSRYMPPWSADPDYQSYLYEKSLSAAEIKMIAQWVDQGYPEGDSTLVVQAADYVQRDTFSPSPDLTVCMEEAWKVIGNNKDQYHTFVIPISLEEDQYVQAFQFKPGNISAVHHAQVLVDTSGMAYAYDQQSLEYGFDTFSQMKLKVNGILTGYLPGGTRPVKYPDGTGKKLSKEAFIIFNIHYAPTPVELWDQSCVDIYFSKEGKNRDIKGATVNKSHIVNGAFLIKANRTKRFHAIKTIPQDISLTTVWPHMHFRGQLFEAYVKTPDHQTIPLIKIKDWDFNWQNAYFLKKLIKIPAGSKVHLIGSFDNRSSNPANPVLPPVDVEWGSSSFDEMLILGMEYLDYLPGDEHQAITAY